MAYIFKRSMKQLFSNFITRQSFVIGFLLLNCLGCSGTKEDPRGERVSVSGLVYFDEDPLTSARILFISETPEGKIKSAGIVSEGIFQIPQKGGPVVGESRVEIYPTIPEMEEFIEMQEKAKKQGKPFKDPASIKIPVTYNKNSKLTAMVTKDGKNTFEFKIESK